MNKLISRPRTNSLGNYYDSVTEDYNYWSRQGYMHFGYWRWPMLPSSRKRMLEAMNDEVFQRLQLAELASGSHIADLGCGRGAVSRYGAKKFRHLHWHGLTNSPYQLDQCKLRQLSDPKVESALSFLLGDYHCPPWPEKFLSAAFFIESFCYVRDLNDLLRQLHLKLRPGGRLVIADAFLRKPLSRTSSIFQSLHDRVCRNWSFTHFVDRDQFLNAAQQCQFRIIADEEIGWRVVPSLLHSPWLVFRHFLRLLKDREPFHSARGQHLAACGLAPLLAAHRNNFGYYLMTLERI